MNFGRNNKINVNFIHEKNLHDIDHTGRVVWLQPVAIIYRGYDQQYKVVDTLNWYDPRRPLFFGSHENASFYSFQEEKAKDFPVGQGPIYRFWSKRPLRLYSLNQRNVVNLVKMFLDQEQYLTAARLIFAYGFLYNLRQGFKVVDKLKDSRLDTVRNLVYDLKKKLQSKLDECVEECPKEKQALRIGETCYDFCMNSPKELGRTSKYGVDKPLIGTLQKLLERQGYDGIFAWVDPDKSKFYHDIIIFNHRENLQSDNVNVNECITPRIKDCPKETVPRKLPKKVSRSPRQYFTRNY